MSSRTGQRRTRVEVQANTPSADEVGQLRESWATVATLSGFVRPATGKEIPLGGGQLTSLLWHVVETRWPGALVTVTPQHRLLINGRHFDVTWASNVSERNKDLFIGCTERLAPQGD